jgi:hypothetical protein
MGKAAEEKVRVAIVKSTDRGAGFSKAVELLGDIDLAEKEVYLKCNYNSPIHTLQRRILRRSGRQTTLLKLREVKG